jgi:hypothetical protein
MSADDGFISELLRMKKKQQALSRAAKIAARNIINAATAVVAARQFAGAVTFGELTNAAASSANATNAATMAAELAKGVNDGEWLREVDQLCTGIVGEIDAETGGVIGEGAVGEIDADTGGVIVSGPVVTGTLSDGGG